MLSNGTRVVQYDTIQFGLREGIRAIFGGAKLGKLHEQLRVDLPHMEPGLDQKTLLHETVYRAFPQFHELYISFVRHVAITEWQTDAIIYQRIPTFRFQLPGSVAVAEFHTDRMYGHGDGEVNVWVPLVDALGTCALRIEKCSRSGRLEAEPVKYGEYLVFDGVNLRHGNSPNQSDLTRVSFDFRVAAAADFVPQVGRSISAGRRFDLDEYFAIL